MARNSYQVISSEKGSALLIALVFVALVGAIMVTVQQVNSSTNKPQQATKDASEGAKALEMYAKEVKKGIETAEQQVVAGAAGCPPGLALKIINGRPACFSAGEKNYNLANVSYNFSFKPADLQYDSDANVELEP